MRVFALLLLAIAAAAAVPDSVELQKPNRINGGWITTINQYPYTAALLFSSNLANYWLSCGGTIINSRSILSAANCFFGRTAANQWRIRVGSTWANVDGTVYNTASIIIHPNYDNNNMDSDVAILRSASTIIYNSNVQAGSIAGVNHNLGDNQQVTAIGWGSISSGEATAEQLRYEQTWIVNQDTCAQRYNSIRRNITANMLCSGWLEVGGRAADRNRNRDRDRNMCPGHSGGPLLHNRVVVGVVSWARGCAQARLPGVNTRVSRFSNWIVSNAF